MEIQDVVEGGSRVVLFEVRAAQLFQELFGDDAVVLRVGF